DSLRHSQRRFSWVENASDGEVRDLIVSSRATIFTSLVEGFGLPPLESLALGVPVIVSTGLPSLESIPPLGQIRLANPNAVAIGGAVRELLDNDKHRVLREQIRELRVPTWADFGQRLASWIEGELEPAKAA